MVVLLELILVIIGLAAGCMGSLLGLGGGIIIVPALLEVARVFPELSMVTPAIAVGTSLVLVLLGSFSATLTYIRQKRVNFKKGALFFLGCSPGSLLGSYLASYVQSASFYIGFGMMILTLSFLLDLKQRAAIVVEGDRVNIHPVLLGFVSVTVGIVSGLFGIGGGILLLPFMLFSGFPIHLATATSGFIIFLSSFVGAATHVYLGDVHWPAVFCLGPGVILGGWIGACLSPGLRKKTLLRVLRLLLLLIGIQFILRGFGW